MSLLLLNSSILKFIQDKSQYITIFFGVSIFMFYIFNAFWGVFYSALYQSCIPINMLGRYAATEGGVITLARLLGLKMYGYFFDMDGLIIPMSVLGVGIILKILVQVFFIRETRNGIGL